MLAHAIDLTRFDARFRNGVAGAAAYPPAMLLKVVLVAFALVGGVWLMWMLGYNMSVAVAIGFIALAGVAAETGVIMPIYLDHARRARADRGALRNRSDVDAAIEHGAVERVRPKIMTVTAIMAGLIPILWSQGAGADMMKRIAALMVGGMLSSTLLTLIVIPAIYSLWKKPFAAPGHETP